MIGIVYIQSYPIQSWPILFLLSYPIQSPAPNMPSDLSIYFLLFSFVCAYFCIWNDLFEIFKPHILIDFFFFSSWHNGGFISLFCILEINSYLIV